MNNDEIAIELNMRKTEISDKVLFIFENEKEKQIFKRYYDLSKDEGKYYIFVSLEKMHTSRNALTGRRFRKYRFVDDEYDLDKCMRDIFE